MGRAAQKRGTRGELQLGNLLEQVLARVDDSPVKSVGGISEALPG